MLLESDASTDIQGQVSRTASLGACAYVIYEAVSYYEAFSY
jgi:hypothetical protein